MNDNQWDKKLKVQTIGRVGLFLVHELNCTTIGIEYDPQIYKQAQENLQTYAKKQKVKFLCMNAEEYNVKGADCFYFFNPFSVVIFSSVLGKIIESYYENARNMKLFFYYPNDEYLAELVTRNELMFLDEIDCKDLFEGENERERILIFEI